ncbi:hypothetical protein LCGC14_2371110, partial [marine sediment metagenome]
GGVFCTTCFETRPEQLTREQYLEVLHKIRDRIASGTAVGLDDSNTIGYKHTHCAWGVCTDSAKVWSRPEYHIWPMYFKEDGRVAPLHRPSKCPLDARKKGAMLGCFYKCLAFQPPKGFVLTRDHTLQLYNTEIEKLKRKGGKQ